MDSTSDASGNTISTGIPYRCRTVSIIWWVSSGKRPVSMVKTRTRGSMRVAMSITTMPSFWKLVEMARESPKVERAQESTFSAVADSRFGKYTNLYQDTPDSQKMSSGSKSSNEKAGQAD